MWAQERSTKDAPLLPLRAAVKGSKMQCTAGMTTPIICSRHDKETVKYYCSNCEQFGCKLCTSLHTATTCRIFEIETESKLTTEKVLAALSELECLRCSLSKELSDLVALSEERLILVQSQHVEIDDEADIAIRKLTRIIASVNENRKACHEELEILVGEQVHVIQAHVKTLETRLGLVADYLEISHAHAQAHPRRELDVEAIETGLKIIGEVESLLEREGDMAARAVIDHQPHPVVVTKPELVNYLVPVVERISAVNYQAHSDIQYHHLLKDGVSVMNCNVNFADMEIACVNNQYSTFLSEFNSGCVGVFNTITGEPQRTIGTGLREVYGLAILPTPLPYLFVSSFNQHKINFYNAMSGELVKEIRGHATDQLNFPLGVCARASPLVNQAPVLYVCDGGNNRVQVFDTESGRSVMTIGTGTKGCRNDQFNRPVNVTVFEGNKVVKHPMLVVSDYSNHRVQLFHASTGTYLKTCGQGVAGAAAGQLHSPKGVAVCALDHVSDPLLIVSEESNHRIQIFNIVSGASLKCVGSKGSNVDQLCYPRGLRAFLVAKDELVVYVTDYDNKRVQKIDISLHL